MPPELIAVRFEVPNPGEVAEFWSRMLGREISWDPDGPLVVGSERQIGLRFVPLVADALPGPNPVHLHLTTVDLDDQRTTVDRAVRLGGRIIRQGPEYEQVVMADPGRNEFCVIEPDNQFLAGTGFLGEVTCEGTPAVGLFWREVLSWDLVWERDLQTAIQSPLGGTKLSWDVRSPDRPYGSRTQTFELEAPDVGREAKRLVELGAAESNRFEDGIRLADPDGKPFLLRQAGT